MKKQIKNEETPKIDEITEIKQEIKEIKSLLEQMNATLKKLLDVLPFKKWKL